MRAWILLLPLSLPAGAADVEEAARSAHGAFLQGRYEDAAAGWRYLGELGAGARRPEPNEALSLRDAGAPEAALPLWLKASLLEGADGFVWNQRAWTYLGTGRLREARESFAKAIDRSGSAQTQAEANLGLGLAALADRKPRGALEPLRRAQTSGPFAISAAAQLIAEAALSIDDPQTALNHLRQALDVDGMNREALRGMVRLLDKIGDNKAAWRAARRALVLDPGDADAKRVLDRNARFIVGDPEDASGARRIARPVLDASSAFPPLPKSSRTLRVGLYGAPDGRPATMTRCYLMLNAPFQVDSKSHGVLRDDGRPYDQWEIEWRAETGAVEVRDAARNILFVSKQPFRFSPLAERSSVLIKSARLVDPAAVDIGDREVRGALEVFPNPWGFRLVSTANLEHYLYGVVSLALPEGSPPEAYKAQAVVARTAAAWAIGRGLETAERFDVLDDHGPQRTIGVSGELRAAQEGVSETEGMILALGGAPARVLQHEDSGGRTEDGRESGEGGLEHLVSVADSAKPGELWSSPLELERFTHETPPLGLYSEAVPGASAAVARWVRVLDAKDLRSRVARRKDVGPIRHVRVAARTPTGRVKALEVIGPRGSVHYVGRAEVEDLLSPGTLRSTLFTLQPLSEGKDLSRLLVWGAGTGSGIGFSKLGAAGQAALGKDWKSILAHYFPKLSLRSLERAPELPAAKKPVGPYRRTLNYRQQPKK